MNNTAPAGSGNHHRHSPHTTKAVA